MQHVEGQNGSTIESGIENLRHFKPLLKPISSCTLGHRYDLQNTSDSPRLAKVAM